MSEKIEAIKVYCPICAEQGRKKWIITVSPDAHGVVFPLCKIHGNVRVDLGHLDGEKIHITVSA